MCTLHILSLNLTSFPACSHSWKCLSANHRYFAGYPKKSPKTFQFSCQKPWVYPWLSAHIDPKVWTLSKDLTTFLQQHLAAKHASQCSAVDYGHLGKALCLKSQPPPLITSLSTKTPILLALCSTECCTLSCSAECYWLSVVTIHLFPPQIIHITDDYCGYYQVAFSSARGDAQVQIYISGQCKHLNCKTHLVWYVARGRNGTGK